MDELRGSWWLEAGSRPQSWFYERVRAETERLSSLTNDARAQSHGMVYHRLTRKQKADKEFAR